MKYLKNKKIMFVISSVVTLVLLVLMFFMYINRYNPILFVGDFSEQEKIKIQMDLELVYKDYFEQGLKMEVKKETLHNNCNENCERYYVKYIHNKYGDWVPGTLYMEEGVYKYRPSI